MATSCRRRRQGVPATAAKFFKIILNPESDNLRIPMAFTRRHGQDLRNRVFLKVPEGSAMEVELIQSGSNGETWVQKGWVEFKDRYSIGFGYLLVFTYNGNSQFDVLIFDTTASEISYPIEETQSESESDNDNDDDDVSRNPLVTEQDGEKRERFPSTSKTFARERCIAYQKALTYKRGDKSNTSQQKPFFISLMQQSYVSHNYILTVPVSFMKTNIPSKGTENLHLMMNGRKWRVRCWVEPGYKRAKISRGWRKFAQDNGLKIGDACIFEARKRAELVWDVMVFRS